MSKTIHKNDAPSIEDELPNEVGFQMYLHDIADHLFPFPGYRAGQGEALYEALESLFINGCDNVILDLPTGVGKSPLNVTLARVMQHLASNKRDIEGHFGVTLDLDRGDAFYTTPQKQLRNQLAEDEDLQEHVAMLKARADYTCGETGDNCDSCSIKSDPEQSCMQQSLCTYWNNKMKGRQAPLTALTFAMLIVDNSLPPETPEGVPLSFRNRDMVIVDEGHNLENQAASLFAGFSISPWSLPEEVFQNAGARVGWNDDRYEDVKDVVEDINRRARNFVRNYEDNPNYDAKVESCENFLRKHEYAINEIRADRPWVVNIDETKDRNGDKTKKIQMKPVYVDNFLNHHIWSRGKKRVISSATIPYRGKISEWCDRIGLPGKTNLISKTMPFPKVHRLIHTNTTTGPMSGDDEEKNWNDAMQKIREIHSHHEGENGLIHTASYKRAQEVQDSLGSDLVMVQPDDLEKDKVIEMWNESDQDILVSPSMVEGVDLYEDRCRWQVLLKVPFPFVGDSRVSYLLNENHDWEWYFESCSLDIQQSVGRAVRGPEPKEASSYYVIDSKFGDVKSRTRIPNWFTDAVTDEPPEHWDDPAAAPWR
jgi:Rad3-related DNA helicase